jgi:hypothetical protein
MQWGRSKLSAKNEENGGVDVSEGEIQRSFEDEERGKSMRIGYKHWLL